MLRSLDGTVLRTSAPFQVPANGEVSMFLTQVPGFETLAAPFEGILRLSSPQGATATAFRQLYNDKGGGKVPVLFSGFTEIVFTF